MTLLSKPQWVTALRREMTLTLENSHGILIMNYDIVVVTFVLSYETGL